ncbi:MAG TPA: VWA domain-containing protein [Kofleriaceae bacterium]
MSFAHPDVLWLAAATPLILLLLYLFDRVQRRKLASRIGELPVLQKVMVTASPRRRLLKLILCQIGLGLVVYSLARPQVAGTRKVELRGLDLVIALDVSKSMLVEDVGMTIEMQEKALKPSRLARARELATALVDELPEDRVGPVVFAGAAAHFPVTEDHQVAVRFMHDLGPADLPPGSNVAEVFRVSRCLLRPDLYDDLGCARIGRRGHGGDPLAGESLDPTDKPAEDEVVEQQVERGKAIVILTDGGESDADTLREVATARELGIAVFVIGVGTTQGGVVHEIDYEGRPTATPKKNKDGSTVVSKRDDAGMKLVAEAGGDPKRYFIASERGEIDPMPIVDALRGVNRGLATKKVDEKRDIFQPFLFAGLLLLVIEAAISTRRRRRYPEEH